MGCVRSVRTVPADGKRTGRVEELTAAREAAMVAHDQFVDIAARYLSEGA
ncbi:hypothetical protein [Streptomyces sp. NPDC006638]